MPEFFGARVYENGGAQAPLPLPPPPDTHTRARAHTLPTIDLEPPIASMDIAAV